jgi:capsular exopolysaccharide synthesis family protein
VENEKLDLLERSTLAQRLGGADPIIDVSPRHVEPHSALLAYWEILSKHRWEVVAVILGALTVAAIYSFKTKPVYRATARVEIESETPQIPSIRETFQNPPMDEGFLRTQVNILESDNLAWQTIQQVGLARTPEYVGLAENGKEKSLDARTVEGRLLAAFKRSLIVALSPNTHIVEASFESTDPYLAARVINALVNNYMEYNFHTKYDATRQASGFLEGQLDELKARVEKSQSALVDYERQNSIVNVNDKQNVVEQRLADLTKDLTAAESDRAQKEALFQLVQSNPSQVALLAQDELLQRLAEKSADLKSQYTEALEAAGPNFPKVVRLGDQLKVIETLIDQERKRTVERIQNDYKAALAREQLMASAVAEQKLEVGKLNQLLIQHNILKREFETNQQLYDSLLQRLKDATVSAGLRATNIHVVDDARPPALPVRPKKLTNIAVGLIVGLLVGVALAFAREGLERSSIKTPEDVERLVDAPALAVIPSAARGAVRGYPLARRRETKDQKDGAVSMAVLKQPNSPIAESYRALRSSILFSRAAHPPRALLVTSSQPNEGKTCTSLNLALALAQNGSRVLLMDGDLRAQGVSKELGLVAQKGLSAILAGASTLDQALRPLETSVGLWVLPGGPRPPNPTELLSSPGMEKLLGELMQRFEYVVLDSPPLLLVTDGTILSTLVDGVILVVESGVTTPGALVRSERILKSSGGKLLGVVVNKMDLHQGGNYYSSYYSYYGSYYGSSNGEESTPAT